MLTRPWQKRGAIFLVFPVLVWALGCGGEAAEPGARGYAPDREQYEEQESPANYERFISMFGPDTGEILSSAARRSAKGLY